MILTSWDIQGASPNTGTKWEFRPHIYYALAVKNNPDMNTMNKNHKNDDDDDDDDDDGGDDDDGAAPAADESQHV